MLFLSDAGMGSEDLGLQPASPFSVMFYQLSCCVYSWNVLHQQHIELQASQSITQTVVSHHESPS